MNLIQFRDDSGSIKVGLVENQSSVRPLGKVTSVYDLALKAIENGQSLSECAEAAAEDKSLSYDDLAKSDRLAAPIHHPDPAHLYVTGTGLTHLGSADARANMHANLDKASDLTDSMKLFRMGIDGGKPAGGGIGVQPEWFYKGDGSIITDPGAALTSPSFALDGGEEPEIAGIYVIGPDGAPYRLGFVIGNEFSDHKMEKINYLYLAHSKLRACAIGPELALGDLPQSIEGRARILRNGEAIWEKPFLSGEANMCHSLDNLEAHHFKYAQFRRPGDIHVHFFGTATLSFSDGVGAQQGDVFEVSASHFGRPLSNPLVIKSPEDVVVKSLG